MLYVLLILNAQKTPLETFFSKNELDQITKIGGFQTALENAIKQEMQF